MRTFFKIAEANSTFAVSETKIVIEEY